MSHGGNQESMYTSADGDGSPKVLLTGATGRVGRCIAEELRAAGIRFRVFVRSSAAAASLEATEIVEGTFSAGDKLRQSMRGIDALLLISGDAPNQSELEIGAVRAAAECGVRRIIKLSAQSAGLQPPRSFGRNHRCVEEAIEASPLSWTFVRPVFFQQSFALFAGSIKSGKLILPAGSGKVAFVDVRDVAAAMVAVLREPGHERRIYTLTGPQALSFVEAAALLSAQLCRPVKYISPPAWLARIMLPLAAGMPRWLTREVIELLQAIADGAQASVSSHVEVLLRRPARSLSAYFTETLSQFR